MLYHTIPGFPPSNALAVKKCLGVNTAPLAQRDPPQLQGLITFDSALLYWNIPIYSRYLHFAVYYNRPILILFLDYRRGREKLSRKERGLLYKEGVYNFGYYTLRPLEGFKQISRLAYSRFFLSSGVLATNSIAGAV